MHTGSIKKQCIHQLQCVLHIGTTATPFYFSNIFFVARVCLQVVLCFSPVGTTLRVRARKFPAIVNCTNIDWFHEWPEEALLSVSTRFLSEVDLIKVSLHEKKTYRQH